MYPWNVLELSAVGRWYTLQLVYTVVIQLDNNDTFRPQVIRFCCLDLACQLCHTVLVYPEARSGEVEQLPFVRLEVSAYSAEVAGAEEFLLPAMSDRKTS